MIDSHIHLFEHGVLGDRPAGSELSEYEAFRTTFGIEAALVVGYEGAQHRGNNNYLAGVAANRPWIRPLAYVAASDGQEATTAIPVDELSPFVGIACYLLTQGDVTGLLAWTADEWALVPRPGIVSINTTSRLLPQIAELAASQTALTFVLSHLGTPPPVGSRGPRGALSDLLALAALPNVHVKLSGYYTLSARGWSVADQAAATTSVVDAFGPRRVHWGSDFSPCLLTTTFADTVSAPGMDLLTSERLRQVRGASLSDLLHRR